MRDHRGQRGVRGGRRGRIIGAAEEEREEVGAARRLLEDRLVEQVQDHVLAPDVEDDR